MRVYYTVRDNGDRSASVCFFDSKECIEWLESEDNPDVDSWRMGEGGSYFDVEVRPTRIRIDTLEDIKKEEEENA